MFSVLDLFSGIGGFSLGLERAGGFSTAAFCEQAGFPRQVLRKHWLGVPIYPDIRGVNAAVLALDGLRPGVVCGGFPCQDISVAGRGAGLAGGRSGLWFEMLRIIDEVQPRYVIAENVSALRGRGLEIVLGGLAALGYDAEWHCVPASAVGAPHRRDRVWIVAYPDDQRRAQPEGRVQEQRGRAGYGGEVMAHLDRRGRRVQGHERSADGGTGAGQPGVGGEALAYPGEPGLPGAECAGWPEPLITPADIRRAVAQCYWRRLEPRLVREANGLPARVHRYPVEVEPWEGNTPRTVGRGLPDRRARIMALGNSIVPHMAELIGRAILRREADV